ncbi:MAG: phosphotransferase family protein [Halobacteriota archaeon]
MHNLLEYYSVVPYLISLGLLEFDQACNGLEVEEATCHRNKVFRVKTADGPSYLIKQGDVEGTIQFLNRELQAYRLVGNWMSEMGYADAIPNVHWYDEPSGILILELLDDAQDLDSVYVQRGWVNCSIACRLGAVLARLHTFPSGNLQQIHDLVSVGPPWILSIHRPSQIDIAQQCQGQSQVVKLVQQFPKLADNLSALEEEWQDEVLIHNDLRWSNVLAPVSLSRSQHLRVTIVDWELARAGDPRWDVGTILAEYLMNCFLNYSTSTQSKIPGFVGARGRRRKLARHSICAMWKSYAEGTSLTLTEQETWLSVATRYAAAKLIQTSFELADNQVGIPERAIDLLQASLNIFCFPDDIVTGVFGLGGTN